MGYNVDDNTCSLLPYSVCVQNVRSNDGDLIFQMIAVDMIAKSGNVKSFVKKIFLENIFRQWRKVRKSTHAQ